MHDCGCEVELHGGKVDPMLGIVRTFRMSG